MLSYNTAPLIDRSGVQAKLPAGRKVLVPVSTPTGAEYVVIDPRTGSKTTNVDRQKLGLPEASAARRPAPRDNEVPSPDGKRAAFINDWNLWVRDVPSGKETQLTTDGVKDFGYATDNAGWSKATAPILLWSPDSKKIATFQQDERNVSDMYLVRPTSAHPKLASLEYPLPGDKNDRR